MSIILEVALIENTLSLLLNTISKKIFLKPEDRAHFDFVFQDENGKKTILEVKSNNVSASILRKLRSSLISYNDVDKFLLITPLEPSKNQIREFNIIFGNTEIDTYWYSITEYLKMFDININDNTDLEKLQLAGIISKISKYKSTHIGTDFYEDGLKEYKVNYKKVQTGELIANKFKINLRRQFPLSILADLPDLEHDIVSNLLVGKEYKNSIIVITDLKNFSTIVSASMPDLLQEVMNRYYVNARELVFKYNGILDKFIGDSVLAIFNYPIKNENFYLEVLKFSAELILLGKELLNELLNKMDNVIETGTRIGITTGSVYPLNIGKEEFELTFIGNKINLAARLESKCLTNGILLSNSYFNLLKQNYEKNIEKLEIKERIFPQEEMKGQISPIRSWQIEKKQIASLLEL